MLGFVALRWTVYHFFFVKDNFWIGNHWPKNSVFLFRTDSYQKTFYALVVIYLVDSRRSAKGNFSKNRFSKSRHATYNH